MSHESRLIIVGKEYQQDREFVNRDLVVNRRVVVIYGTTIKKINRNIAIFAISKQLISGWLEWNCLWTNEYD